MEDAAPTYLTVPELAALLRIKDRKVYDLAASGDVPCSRATGKLLFPRAEVEAWIADASSGAFPTVSGAAEAPRPAVLLGSFDPLLEWALRQSQCGLATLLDGSLDGVTRFTKGEGVAAGLHVIAGDSWNTPLVSQQCSGSNAVLVSWAKRSRGIVLRLDDAGTIRNLADLRGRRFAPRQPEAGCQVLFDHLLKDAGLSADQITMTATARSESDAALAVARGAADAAFGLGCLAAQHGLSFVPLISEDFDLLADRNAWFAPPLQKLFAFTKTAAFAEHAAALSGYDVSTLGQVKWNA